MLNIRQIEVFRAVMLSGSVTTAAESMHVTQPSVSKHLKLLEHWLGLNLFERTGNRLVPTVEARALFDQVERTYSGLDALTRFADDLKNNRQGEILVAAMPLIAHSWLPDIIARFLSENNDVSMSLPVRSSRWIGEWVAAGRVDFGIGLSFGADIGVQKEMLMQLPLVCVMPASHQLAKLEEISPSQLSGETLISLSNFDQWRLTVESALDREQVHPHRRIDTFTTYTACELVQRGLGVAIVDAITALKYEGAAMSWRPFTSELVFEIYLIRPLHWQVSMAAEAFITLIQQQAGETLARIEELL